MLIFLEQKKKKGNGNSKISKYNISNDNETKKINEINNADIR